MALQHKNGFDTAFQALIFVIGALVLIENTFLRRENNDLRSRLGPEVISAGMRVREIAAVNMDGVFTSVPLPTAEVSRLLVLSISPECSVCQRNQHVYAAVAKALHDRSDLRVLWISRGSVQATREYAIASGVPLAQVVAEPAHRTYRDFGLEAVPQALLIARGGIVEESWNGQLQDAFVGEFLRSISKGLTVSAEATKRVVPPNNVQFQRFVSLFEFHFRSKADV